MSDIPLGRFGFVKQSSFHWMGRHLSGICSVAIVIVCGLLFLSRWIGGDGVWKVGGSSQDYWIVERLYREWKGGKDDQFAQLQKILHNRPELHTKYDGGIAQKLLGASESGLARIYGSAALRQAGSFSDYHAAFSRATLLISEGKFLEALSEAKTLKERINADPVFWEKKSAISTHGSVLYAFNLLRIAMLEQQAGTVQGEREAWEQLQQNGGWLTPSGGSTHLTSHDPKAYLLLQQNFQMAEVSLLDYIEYRKHQMEDSNG